MNLDECSICHFQKQILKSETQGQHKTKTWDTRTAMLRFVLSSPQPSVATPLSKRVFCLQRLLAKEVHSQAFFCFRFGTRGGQRTLNLVFSRFKNVLTVGFSWICQGALSTMYCFYRIFFGFQFGARSELVQVLLLQKNWRPSKPEANIGVQTVTATQ